MGLHDVLHDRETEARAARLAAAGLVDAVKPLEKPRQVLGGDAAALIAHGDRHAPRHRRVGRRGDPHRPARLARLDRVVNEIDHRLLDQRRVDVGDELVVALALEVHLAVGGPRPAVGDGLGEHRGQGHPLQRQVARPLRLLDPREGEQILDDRFEPIGLPRDDLEKAAAVGRVFGGAVQERLHKALDRRDRRLEFVRHVGHKIPADVFQPLQVGDVVEHDDRAPFAGDIAERRATDADRAVAGAAQDDVILHRLATVDGQEGEPPQVGVAHHFLQRLEEHAVDIEAEQIGRTLIDAHDPLPRVDREHALDHAAEHRLLLRALPADREPAFHQLVADRLDRVGQVGKLGRLRHREPRLEFSAGHPRRGLGELTQRPRRPARHRVGRRQRHDRRRQRAGE